MPRSHPHAPALRRIGRLLFASALFVACSGPNSDAGTTASLTEDRARELEAELVAADRAFADAVERHGLGGWINAFAPSGRMIAGGESFVGREGVRRAMLAAFADTTFSISWDPTYAEVAASGDLGYTIGRYERQAGEANDRQVETGSYLTVWRRQPNGTWKVMADIGSEDALEIGAAGAE